MLYSKCFHLICTPNRCLDICTGLSRELKAKNDNDSKPFKTPILIWEPGATSPTTFSECVIALNHIDIFSPNAKEAADFLGLPEPETKQQVRKVALQFLVHMIRKRVIDIDAENEDDTLTNNIPSISNQLLTSHISSPPHASLSLHKERSLSNSRRMSPAWISTISSSNPYPRAVVIRCGSKGCAIYSLTKFPTSVEHTDTVIPIFFDITASSNEKMPTALRYYEAWFPAYHDDPNDIEYKVEDLTGSGNTFLGGFAAGYLNDNNGRSKIGNLAKAAIYGMEKLSSCAWKSTCLSTILIKRYYVNDLYFNDVIE